MIYVTTQEHEELRAKVRAFAEAEVKPIAFKLDRENCFPRDAVAKMGELGLMGLPYEKEYEGAGLDVLSYAIAVEELSRVDGGTGVILSAHTSLGTYPIAAFGSEEQKRKYLPDLCSGRKIGAFGLTEPNAGSDAGGTETTAEDMGDYYLLNGEKIFITNGGEAHTVAFVNAPMVHWPEAMVSFDTTNGVLFSADAFGSFRSLDGKLFSDEFDFRGEWIDDARRYLTNIVGKYGPPVQSLLKKAAGLPIKYICPLHGPVWRDPDDIAYILDKYIHWSTYEPEEKGVMIVYGSMYGNTEQAAEILASKLAERGVTNTRLYDVSSTHVSYLISDVFKYSHLVLACVTYNLGIFPPMHNFLMDMKALNVQNRTVAVMENGSWAIRSGSLIREFLDGMKRMNVLEEGVTMASSLGKQNMADMDALADAIAADLKK